MAASPSQSEIDREPLLRSIWDGLMEMPEDDRVLFAARCAWRTWPLACDQGMKSELQAAQLQPALAVATLRGAGYPGVAAGRAFNLAAAVAAEAAEAAVKEHSWVSAPVHAVRAAFAAGSETTSSAAASAAYTAAAVIAKQSELEFAYPFFAEPFFRSCADDVKRTSARLRTAPLWDSRKGQAQIHFEAISEVSFKLGPSFEALWSWYDSMCAGSLPLLGMADWLSDWWRKHPENPDANAKLLDAPIMAKTSAVPLKRETVRINLPARRGAGVTAPKEVDSPLRTPAVNEAKRSTVPVQLPSAPLPPPAAKRSTAPVQLPPAPLPPPQYAPFSVDTGASATAREQMPEIPEESAVVAARDREETILVPLGAVIEGQNEKNLGFDPKAVSSWTMTRLPAAEVKAQLARGEVAFPLGVLVDRTDPLFSPGAAYRWHRDFIVRVANPEKVFEKWLPPEELRAPSFVVQGAQTPHPPVPGEGNIPEVAAPEEPPETIQKHYKLKSTTSIVPDCEAAELTKTAKECMLALRAFLISPETQAPLTVSVEAPWGGGKSSMLRQLQKTLETDGIPTVWFNPWKHEAGKTLWAAFALSFERQMSDRCGRWRRWTRRIGLAWARLEGVERTQLVIRVVFWVGALMALGCLAWAQRNAALTAEWKGLLLQHAPWLGFVATFYGFLTDTVKRLGSPLKVDVAKLLTHSDHDDKVDDLHRFHEDFRRLLDAYIPAPKSGRQGRVVVFIDDLDRCEAPKAADLLQSLHQMLNVSEDRPSSTEKQRPAPGVICILGMDRDKVAAAIAAKHEKLLPHLYEADEKGRVPRGQALDFGHEYLEKFIQLTLHLPGMHGDDRSGYLRSITGWSGVDMPEPRAATRRPSALAAPDPVPAPVSSPSNGEETVRLSADEPVPVPGAADEQGRAAAGETPLESDLEGMPAAAQVSASLAASAAAVEQAAVQKRIRIVDEDLNDGHIAYRCAMDAGEALENNPRKLKQFVNLFRLRLYLGAALEVLDSDTLRQETTEVKSGKLSAQHIAKLVALDLACPLKMSEARDQPGQGLLDQVLACGTGNAAVQRLIDRHNDQGPMHDLKAAPLDLYFQNFVAPV